MLIMTFMHFSVKSSWMAHNQFEMCGFSYKSKRYSSKWRNSMCRIKKSMHTYNASSFNRPLLYIAKYGGIARVVLKGRSLEA